MTKSELHDVPVPDPSRDPIVVLRRQPYFQLGIFVAACAVLLVEAARGGNWMFWSALDGLALVAVGLALMIYLTVWRPAWRGAWIAVVPVLDVAAAGMIWGATSDLVPSAALLFLPPIMWLGLAFPWPFLVAGVILSALAPAILVSRVGDPNSGDIGLLGVPMFPLVAALVGGSAYAVGRIIRSTHEGAVAAQAHVTVALRSQRDQALVFGTVLEASPNAIAVITPRGRVLHRNAAFDALTRRAGVDLGAESLGQGYVYSEDRVSRFAVSRKALARLASDARPDRRTIWVGPPGDQRAVQLIVQPFSRGGERLGATVIAVDITNLVDAVDLRDRFLDTAGHELRSPLTVLMGELDLLMDEDLPPLPRARVARIGSASERLRGVIDKIIAAGREDVTASSETTDAALTVAQAVEARSELARELGVRLSLRSGGPSLADVDSRLLRRALEELISNALRFTPSGGNVEVIVESDGDRPVIVVRDNGVGMSPGEQRRMFEKFYRTEYAHRHQVSGSGLGLHIVNMICQQCEIDFDVSSAPGRGTAVRLALQPASRARAGSAARA